MAKIVYKGQTLGGGGLSIIKVTRKQYEANSEYYDEGDFIVDIIDEEPEALQLDTKINQTLASLPKGWEKAATYQVGYYCVYNNQLWLCKKQNTGVSPTEGQYWTATSVCHELIKKQDASSNILFKTDIINNGESSDTDKPLSAAYGKALKDYADSIKKTHDLVWLEDFSSNYKDYTWFFSALFNNKLVSLSEKGPGKYNFAGYWLEGAMYFEGSICILNPRTWMGFGTVTFSDLNVFSFYNAGRDENNEITNSSWKQINS